MGEIGKREVITHAFERMQEIRQEARRGGGDGKSSQVIDSGKGKKPGGWHAIGSSKGQMVR